MSFSSKLSVAVPFAVTATCNSLGANPSICTRSVWLPAGTLRMTYRPSTFVGAASVVPCTLTRALWSGALESTATTWPTIVPVPPPA
jgi:hypothetical protein